MISPLLLILTCSLTALGIHYAARFENYDDFDQEPGSTERKAWEERYAKKTIQPIEMQSELPAFNFADNPQWKRETVEYDPQGREIFWWLRFYGDRLPRMMHKPLYSCPICMASVYSIVPVVLFSIALGLAWWIGVIIYFAAVPVVAGLNMLIVYNLNIR